MTERMQNGTERVIESKLGILKYDQGYEIKELHPTQVEKLRASW